MSHAATNWAIEQRGLKPAAKIVLWHLADCHNPSQGCFPSQEYLAHHCEMSRSTVNLHLAKLEDLKLIKRISGRDEVTKKQLPTRYKLAFEMVEKDMETVSEIRTRESEKTVSENEQKPCPKNGKSRVRNSDSNPVREPVREPLSCGDAAANDERENFEKDLEKAKAKEVEAGFWRVIKDWPNFTGMPKEKAKAAWYRLSDDDRKEAEEKRDAWFDLLKNQKRSHIAAPFTYFNERLFAEVDAPKPIIDVTDRYLKPFGREWMALRFHHLALERRKWQPSPADQMLIADGKGHLIADKRHRAEFPAVGTMDLDASTSRPALRPDGFAPDVSNYQKIKACSQEWDAWQDWFKQNDLPPLPMPDGVSRGAERWVWVPSNLPSVQSGIGQSASEPAYEGADHAK